MKQNAKSIFEIPTFSNGLLFLILTLLWSWTFLVIAILRGEDAMIFPTSLLRLLAGLGPFLIAFLLMMFRPDGESLPLYLQRLMDWKKIPKKVLIISIFFQPAAVLLAILSSKLNGYSLQDTLLSSNNLVNPFAILWVVVFTFFFGPFPEELGWRGYALPRLQSRWNPFFASLSLGFVWGLWHIPLFFIPGTYQYNLGFGSPLFWIFILNLLSQSVLITGLVNAAKGFFIPAILFHYMTNLTGEIFRLPQELQIHWSFWTLCAACLVVIYWLFTKQVHLLKTR